MQVNFKNFSIELFNRDVNNSADSGDKFTRWEKYRAELTDFTLRAFEKENCESLIILGAGHLNDLDIVRLSKRFRRIILSDIDDKGAEIALGRNEGLSNISIQKADYTHAKECGLFEGLQDLAKRAAPTDDIIEHINRSFESMLRVSNIRSVKEKYSAVISCPVYTQLIYTQIEVYLKVLYEYGLYEMSELNKILNATYVRMPDIIAAYNDMVLNLVSDGGKYIMISDIIEMPKDSRIHKKAGELMKGNPVNIQLIEKLIKKEGIELAEIGLGDFENKTEVVDKKYFIWPFDETKEYIVCALHGKSFQNT